jgi:hypothetical protein
LWRAFRRLADPAASFVRGCVTIFGDGGAGAASGAARLVPRDYFLFVFSASAEGASPGAVSEPVGEVSSVALSDPALSLAKKVSAQARGYPFSAAIFSSSAYVEKRSALTPSFHSRTSFVVRAHGALAHDLVARVEGCDRGLCQIGQRAHVGPESVLLVELAELRDDEVEGRLALFAERLPDEHRGGEREEAAEEGGLSVASRLGQHAGAEPDRLRVELDVANGDDGVRADHVPGCEPGACYRTDWKSYILHRASKPFPRSLRSRTKYRRSRLDR